jgi:hypothetical protein
LIAALLYGTGMRVLEALRLRVKDVEFERREIIIREGKGRQGSRHGAAQEPDTAAAWSSEHCPVAAQRELAADMGAVQLPFALAAKYPNANRLSGYALALPAQSDTATSTRPPSTLTACARTDCSGASRHSPVARSKWFL